MRDYYLAVDLRGNGRFPEAHSVQCVLEWEGDPADLRPMAAEFYGVPLSQVGIPRENISAGTCEWCGCHFRRPSDALYHCCAAMQEGYANVEPPNSGSPVEPSETPSRGRSGSSPAP